MVAGHPYDRLSEFVRNAVGVAYRMFSQVDIAREHNDLGLRVDLNIPAVGKALFKKLKMKVGKNLNYHNADTVGVF